MGSGLAAALNSAATTGLNRRVGTVTILSPLTINTSSGPLVATAYLDPYAPAIGHVVLVLIDDKGAAIVAGRLMPA